jgi:E3 ubiquitin-protein ligase RNF14
VDKYLDADQETRKAMELQYGSKVLDKVIQAIEMERATEKWLKENSVACIGCATIIQKVDGCNHMVCTVCKTHFCYLCGMPTPDGYQHWNAKGSRCYKKLFYGVDVDNWEPEVWFFE